MIEQSMKAGNMYGKFNLDERSKERRKNLKTDLESLKGEAKLHRLVRRLNFPDAVRYSVSPGSISFHEPTNGWINDRIFHKSLAVLVRHFGIRFNRRFAEYSGNFYWTATTTKGLSIYMYGAVKPENCEVVEYTETVKRFKSICGKAKDEATA